MKVAKGKSFSVKKVGLVILAFHHFLFQGNLTNTPEHTPCKALPWGWVKHHIKHLVKWRSDESLQFGQGLEKVIVIIEATKDNDKIDFNLCSSITQVWLRISFQMLPNGCQQFGQRKLVWLKPKMTKRPFCSFKKYLAPSTIYFKREGLGWNTWFSTK